MVSVSLTDIRQFRVTDLPCVHWQSQKVNKTRKKTYGKAYEITLHLTSGEQVRDIAEHCANGAGRDCFSLREFPLCLKMYSETTWQSNRNEYEMLKKYYHLLPEHLPCPVGWQRQEVFGQTGYLVDSDMLLVQNVGEMFERRLQLLRDSPASDEAINMEVKKWLCELVDMSHAAFQKGIPWYVDMHMDNVTWNQRTGSWYLIDLDVESTRITHPTFEKCWHEGGKHLKMGADKYGCGGHTLIRVVNEHLLNQWTITPDGFRAKLGFVVA